MYLSGPLLSQDKFLKVFQYGSQFLLYYCLDDPSKNAFAASVASTGAAITLHRKLFRMGNHWANLQIAYNRLMDILKVLHIRHTCTNCMHFHEEIWVAARLFGVFVER